MIKKSHPLSVYFAVIFFLTWILPSCAQTGKEKNNKMSINSLPKTVVNIPENMQVATFGTGCFWCTEAIFQQLKGVSKVTSGYSGGHVANPSYEAVCDKTTGHAEVIQLIFDPKVISFDELLEIFWQTHDPTTLNRQGNDAGPQYRSAIFYHTVEQKERAEFFKKKLDESGAFDKPIVTEITPFSNFYSAETYHQNYFKNNPEQGYCYYVIRPKVEKFEKAFKDKIKKQ